MAAIRTAVQPQAAPIPRWVWGTLLAAAATLWVVTFEGGSISQAVAGTNAFVHELFHDGRHLLGVPCH